MQSVITNNKCNTVTTWKSIKLRTKPHHLLSPLYHPLFTIIDLNMTAIHFKQQAQKYNRNRRSFSVIKACCHFQHSHNVFLHVWRMPLFLSKCMAKQVIGVKCVGFSDSPDTLYEWLTSEKSLDTLFKFSDLKLFSTFIVVCFVSYIRGDNCTAERRNKSDNIFLIGLSISQRELNLQWKRFYVFI